jgi:sensor domain CHASE-containing protein
MDDENQQAKGHPAPPPGDDQPKGEGAPPTPSVRRTVRLAPALALSVAVLLATAVALAAWHGYSTAREVTTELMRNRAELVIDSLSTLTRQYMEPPHQQIEYVAKLVDRGEISGDDLGEMSDYLAGALAGTPQVRGIAYIRPSGDVLRVRRAEGDIRVRLSNWSDNPETARRLEWAKSTRETRWGRLIFAEGSGRTLINLQKPLWAKDDFKGLLVAVVPITSLSRFVSRLKVGGGNSFILLG